jgi:hypothetical protein
MAEIKYIVRKAFKYGKVHLKPGDEFIPSGGKFDEQIMKSQLVYADTGKFAAPARSAWRNKRGHAKSGKRGLGGNSTPSEPRRKRIGEEPAPDVAELVKPAPRKRTPARAPAVEVVEPVAPVDEVEEVDNGS